MAVRRFLSATFAFVGAVIAVIGLVVVVAEKQVFDETTVEHTVDRILADPDITRLLAREVTSRAVRLINLADLRPTLEAYVDNWIQTPEVQSEIRSGVLNAYRALMNTPSNRIEFNMPTQAAIVRRELVMLNPSLAAALPGSQDLLRFTLFTRSSLPRAYAMAQSTRTAAWGLFVIGMALIAIGLALGPGRIGRFALVAAVVSIGMLAVWLFIRKGADHLLGGIEDGLSRRVARLSTDQFLHDVSRLGMGVTIFGAIAFIAGLVGMRIQTKYFPPKPKVYQAAAVPPVPPPNQR